MLEFVLCNSINNYMYITENMRIMNCLQKLYMSEQLSDCLMIYVAVDDDVDVLFHFHFVFVQLSVINLTVIVD